MLQNEPPRPTSALPGIIALCVAALWLLAIALYVLNAYVDRVRAESHTGVREYNRFVYVMLTYGREYGRFPGPAFADAVRELKAYALQRDFQKLDWDRYERNRTVWGGPFVYEWLDDGRRVRFRSTGENGVDDHGGRDDLAIDITVAELGWPATKPAVGEP